MELNKPLAEFTAEECTKWLRELGLGVSGNKEELQVRIRKYLRYPKLVTKLKAKTASQYTFPCSLDPLTIPPPTANWKPGDNLLPSVTERTFQIYISQKKEGSQGQTEKAYRMLLTFQMNTNKWNI